MLTVAALLAGAPSAPVAGQLISPGKLAEAHAYLEGIPNCTRCHELRKRGPSADRCLDCHTPLARRIERGAGFHASLVSPDCATCHKDHLGRDFGLVRLDSLTFDHALAGYPLDGRHTEVGCRECHTPERIEAPDVRAFKSEHGALPRTFLGLPTACASCHETDGPHGVQFADRPCADCHDTGDWDGANGFDHDRADYPLTGAHRTAPCSGCHETSPGPPGRPPPVRYRPVSFRSCADCHDDAHDGAMPGACASCHGTGGWRSVDRTRVEATFDHGVTGFALEGAHDAASCASCHDASVTATLEWIRIAFLDDPDRTAFPRPEAGSCRACHEDRHDGAFPDVDGAGDCAECHGQAAWHPASYDRARHDRESGFRLEGAHRTVACQDCHVPTGGAPTFRVDTQTCVGCHQQHDPHGAQFDGRSCDDCHGLDAFRISAFDHDRTRFPLDGAHAAGQCAACHATEAGPDGTPMVRYRPLGMACRDCHGGGP